jgi:hypothetical protein
MDVEDELNETTERLITENEKLKKDKEILQENINLLKKQLELAHIHINKNSSNSNCPAAHDNPYGKTKKVICSARTKTNLKRGGQKGHTGHFGKLSKNPDEIITHHNEPPPRNGFVDLVNNKIITQVKEMEFKTRIIQHEYTFDDGTKVSSFKILPNAYTYGNSVKSFVI